MWSFTVDQSVSNVDKNQDASMDAVFSIVPGNGVLIFNFEPGVPQNAKIGLFDLQGRELVSFNMLCKSDCINTHTIDIKKCALSKGRYFARLISGPVIKIKAISLR